MDRFESSLGFANREAAVDQILNAWTKESPSEVLAHIASLPNQNEKEESFEIWLQTVLLVAPAEGILALREEPFRSFQNKIRPESLVPYCLGAGAFYYWPLNDEEADRPTDQEILRSIRDTVMDPSFPDDLKGRFQATIKKAEEKLP